MDVVVLVVDEEEEEERGGGVVGGGGGKDDVLPDPGLNSPDRGNYRKVYFRIEERVCQSFRSPQRGRRGPRVYTEFLINI